MEFEQFLLFSRFVHGIHRHNVYIWISRLVSPSRIEWGQNKESQESVRIKNDFRLFYLMSINTDS